METLTFPTATFFHTMHHHTAPDSGGGADNTNNNNSQSFQDLLLQPDIETDRDLDLALSIIHELDVSLIESDALGASAVALTSVPPVSPAASLPWTPTTPDNEMRLLQALYQDDFSNSLSHDIAATSYTLDSFAQQDAFLSSASAFFDLPHTPFASSAATPFAAAPLKRKEKRCTYQNRRVRHTQPLPCLQRLLARTHAILTCCVLQAEIHVLRDQVVALESQVRKLKHRKTRRRHTTSSASSSTNTTPIAELEAENAELKAAVLAQKAQLNSLIERLQANELLVAEAPSSRSDSQHIDKDTPDASL